MRVGTGHLRVRMGRSSTAGAGLLASPALAAVWGALVVLTVLEAVNELFHLGGPPALYEVWVHDIVLASASVLVMARALTVPDHRRAWLSFGLGMVAWSLGTIGWSLAYSGNPDPPYPTFADVLWLLWYPAIVVGIVSLIQGRVPQFELHRWMDGIAVTLLVLVAGFALIVQPVATGTAQSVLATVVDFSYPVLDVLVIGAILGVYGLLGWKPDAMWWLIGLAVVTMAAADAAFAIQEARGVASDGHYDFAWTVGALAVAVAAWVRTPDADVDARPATGMRAIALALVAQALAIGIQIYAIFGEVGKSERIVTAVVLVVASVQIILTRPRPIPHRSSGVEGIQPVPPGAAGLGSVVVTPDHAVSPTEHERVGLEEPPHGGVGRDGEGRPPEQIAE